VFDTQYNRASVADFI